jgi:hypothetical protein
MPAAAAAVAIAACSSAGFIEEGELEDCGWGLGWGRAIAGTVVEARARMLIEYCILIVRKSEKDGSIGVEVGREV